MNSIPATSAVLADSTLVGAALSRAYTAEVDAWLKSVVDGVGDKKGVALAAVGGYGRGDLSLGSDLDLLLLHDGSGAVAEVAEAIWYPIWDSGMKLGHAVRTPEEALDLAADDLDTATSLLDIRLIGGSAALVEELARRSLEQWRESADRMLSRIAENSRERHATSGEVAFLLEPDLKLSQGGLRDRHILHWVDLADSSLLRDSERTGVAGPHETLMSVRMELHRSTGRASNKLLLQDQDEVASVLHYSDADDLMADVAAAGRTISWVHDAVMHRIHVRSSQRRWRRTTRSLGHGVQLVDETLRLAPEADVHHDAVLPLRVGLAAARHEAFIERDVLDRLAASTARLTDPWPDEAREIFVDLLLEGSSAIQVMEALDQVDLVTRILPEWAPNRSRPQRNAYHRFTVDRHLFEAAAEAARLADRVERPDLLVLGALFHDIGKGYPGDHSVVGVELVHRIAVRMGYEPADIETLEAMVRHHLLLPDVASRRDLEDEGTVRFVAEEVGSVGTVELLAALTEADSIATSPAAWGPWKAELVRELAERTTRYLTGGSPMEVAPAFPQPEHLALLETGEEVVRLVDHRLLVVTPDRPGTFSRVAGALALHGVEILGANLHTEGGWAVEEIRVGGGIGLEERPDRVTDDVRLALRRRLAITARLLRRARTYRYQRITTAQPATPQVVVDNETSSTATVLEVTGPDSIGFLFRVTRAFVELDLDIVRAKVQTLGDDVIDSFYVRGPDGEKVVDAEYLAEIEMAVLSAIRSDA